MKIKAIIFGATGMVGEGVLLQALDHPDVDSVLVIGRRSCGRKHQKLKEVIHNDFYNYTRSEEHTSELQSLRHLVCRLPLEKKKTANGPPRPPHPPFPPAHTPPPSPPSPPPMAFCCAPASGGGARSIGEIRGSFFFNDTATTEIYTLSQRGALPI